MRANIFHRRLTGRLTGKLTSCEQQGMFGRVSDVTCEVDKKALNNKSCSEFSMLV